MKGTRATLATLFLLATAAVRAATAHADSLPYEFNTVDILIPGSTTGSFPEDINDDGVILTNIRINNLSEAVIATPVGHKNTKFKTTMLSCTGLAFADTSASSINDQGQMVGSCADSPSAPTREFGFVRRRNG